MEMAEESNRTRTFSESSNQGTLRKQGKYKMEKLDNIINNGEENSKSARESLEKIIDDCELKIKNNASAADFQKVADRLKDYMQERDEIDRNLFESLKKLHHSLDRTVTGLGARVTDLEKEVQELTVELKEVKNQLELSKNREEALTTRLDEVEQKLQLSEKSRARIQLRHFLKRIESMIYKRFFPNTDLSEGTYTVRDLEKKLGQDETNQEMISDFLSTVGFESDFHMKIERVIRNCNLHSYAHPEVEIALNVRNSEDLDKLLEEAQIRPQHIDEIKDFAPCYFRLVEELNNVI